MANITFKNEHYHVDGKPLIKLSGSKLKQYKFEIENLLLELHTKLGSCSDEFKRILELLNNTGPDIDPHYLPRDQPVALSDSLKYLLETAVEAVKKQNELSSDSSLLERIAQEQMNILTQITRAINVLKKPEDIGISPDVLKLCTDFTAMIKYADEARKKVKAFCSDFVLLEYLRTGDGKNEILRNLKDVLSNALYKKNGLLVREIKGVHLRPYWEKTLTKYETDTEDHLWKNRCELLDHWQKETSETITEEMRKYSNELIIEHVRITDLENVFGPDYEDIFTQMKANVIRRVNMTAQNIYEFLKGALDGIEVGLNKEVIGESHRLYLNNIFQAADNGAEIIDDLRRISGTEIDSSLSGLRNTNTRIQTAVIEYLRERWIIIDQIVTDDEDTTPRETNQI